MFLDLHELSLTAFDFVCNSCSFLSWYMNERSFALAKVLVQWTNKRKNRKGKNQKKSRLHKAFGLAALARPANFQFYWFFVRFCKLKKYALRFHSFNGKLSYAGVQSFARYRLFWLRLNASARSFNIDFNNWNEKDTIRNYTYFLFPIWIFFELANIPIIP